MNAGPGSLSRMAVDWPVDLTGRAATGAGRKDLHRVGDVSHPSISFNSPDALQPETSVTFRRDALQLTAQSAHTGEEPGDRLEYFVPPIEVCSQDVTAVLDPYELLRVNPGCDPETIERVYDVLARRYGPENQDTGDAEEFLRLNEAYRILSDPIRRIQYDCRRHELRRAGGPLLKAKTFFAGLEGERVRRLGILCLLYRKRMLDYQRPTLSMLDLEILTGCTTEELGFALWYLTEKKFAIGADAGYEIGSKGMDFVEAAVPTAAECVRLLLPYKLQSRKREVRVRVAEPPQLKKANTRAAIRRRSNNDGSPRIPPSIGVAPPDISWSR